MKDLLADRPLSRSAVIGLLWLYALLGVPHLWHLSPLLMAIYYLALGWRVAALRWPRLLPGALLRGLLTLFGLAAVVVSVAGALDGRALGVGLLTVMAGLKLLELRARRDLFVMVFLGCFLLATQFLFDRGLWLSLYLSPLLLGLFGLLVQLSRVEAVPWPTAWRETGRLMLAGLPMALLLFVLFPRLAGPLWGMASPAAGVTGLSDTLSPGSVSQLGQSREVAFRVSFEGDPPPVAELYWRGPVFWDTDGTQWSAAEPSRPLRRPEAGPGVLYQQVTLEPSNQYWLFALDRAVTRPQGSALSRDGQLLSRQQIRQRRDYRVASDPAAGERVLEAAERRRALALPAALATARMRALVASWQDANPARVVESALAFYRRQPFVYTLQPPLLRGNVVDAFLFDTRRGFCEHYATSFVALMRLAGIPARVVGGYQGGEWNPRGEHYVVRQSDAHAWAEVWLAGAGWVRVDPTAAVAPERIERPIAAAGAAGEAVVFQAGEPGPFGRLWREGLWLVDAMELGWQRWVVGYSDVSQTRLLRRLGLEVLQGYKLALAAVAAAFVGLLPLWWLLRTSAGGGDPLQREYRRLQRKLAAAGLTVAPSTTPSAMARLAGRRFPARAVELQQIVGLYLQLRYAAAGPAAAGLRRLRGRVRRLRLGG